MTFSQSWLVCHEPVPLAFCDAQESSGSRQIASAVLTSVPVPQPVSPAAGTLLLANALAGMILDFKHVKKPKGKTKPQNCEARILHRAGFLCENPKAVPVCSWVLRRVSISFKPFRGWQSPACSNLFWFSPGVSMSFGNSCAGCGWDWVLCLLCIPRAMGSNWKPAQLFAWRQLHKTAGMHY